MSTEINTKLQELPPANLAFSEYFTPNVSEFLCS